MNMRIGIFSYRQAPFISANTDIAYIIARQLMNMGHTVILIGHQQDACQDKVWAYDGMPICYYDADIREHGPLWARIEAKMPDSISLRRAAQGLRQIVTEEKLSHLICFSAPDIPLRICMQAHLDIPVLLHQLDPYYQGYDMIDHRAKDDFLRMLPHIQHVFTTELLYRAYRSESELQPYLGKFSVVQFPKLVKISMMQPSHSQRWRLLYAGSFYPTIRSHKILIELREVLPKDRFEIVFCGQCEDAVTEQLRACGVICRGYCDREELLVEKQAAHVMINIGNKVRNQLGSKLIDYIAVRKPILNLTQFEECPTIDVLKRYPYYLNVPVSELAHRGRPIMTFIEQNGQMIADDAEIRRVYEAYTPEYVAGKVHEQLLRTEQRKLSEK